jgi:hypothetical protein
MNKIDLHLNPTWKIFRKPRIKRKVSPEVEAGNNLKK